MFQSLCCFHRITLTLKVQIDQRPSKQKKYTDSQHRKQYTANHFKAEGMADIVIIAAAMELGSENSCTGGRAEDAQIKNKNQIVDNGNTAHFQRSHLTHHDVIQQ